MTSPFRSRSREWPPPEAGGQTFRASRGQRVLFIAGQAAIPGLCVLACWPSLSGHAGAARLAPAAGVVVTVAAWMWLARRTWQESATVTAEAIVVRNVVRTYRVPAGQVHTLFFPSRGQQLRLLAGRADRAGRAGRSGRHGAQMSITVGAGRLGTAYWSGRRTGADDLAAAIAVVTDLPAPAERTRLMPAKVAAALALGGLLLTIPAVALGALLPGTGALAGAGRLAAHVLSIAAAVAVLPGLCLIADRLAAVSQKSRSMPSSRPRIES
jgi:hypothetical protein